MATHKKEKIKSSPVDEKMESLSLKRKPTLNLADKLDDSLPPIRVSKTVKDFLENHFREKGTQLSNGIRMIIYEYVKKNI